MKPTSDKRWFESKKFLATMIFTAVWALLMGGAFYFMKGSPWYAVTITGMALCLGFIHVLYLGGQAAVDSFVQMASAVTGLFGKKASEDEEPKTDPKIQAPHGDE